MSFGKEEVDDPGVKAAQTLLTIITVTILPICLLIRSYGPGGLVQC